MRLFRRKAGRHELGAAVTAIPVAPAAPALRPATYGAFGRPADEPAAVEPAAVEPAAVEVPPAPRVELGFRDGTSAALAPESAQAKALTEIASALTRRD